MADNDKDSILEVEDREKRAIGAVKKTYGSWSTAQASEDKVNLSKCWKLLLFLLYAVLCLAMLLSMARWGCLMTLAITYFDATLNPGNNSLLDSQLLVLGNLLAQSARVAQFMALIHGLYQFCNILRSQKGLDKLKKISKCSGTCTIHTLIIIGVLLLYGLVTCIPPSLLMVWFEEFAAWHKEGAEQNALIGYTILAWFHHISDLTIRILMGVVTRLIMSAWISGEEELWSSLNSDASMCDKFKSIVQSYKQTGKVAAALQGIFQVWFVMTWLVYFAGITGNTVLVLKALLTNQVKVSPYRFWFYFTHLMNDTLTFLIPYICGGLMNIYQANYRETLEEVQEKLLCDSKELSECLLQNAPLIPENSKYRFVPSLCCLSIPLDSAGYTLTIVLALFGFLMSFVTAFTEV